MPHILLRGLDDGAHAILRHRARRNHRSVNAELLVLIEHALLGAERPAPDRPASPEPGLLAPPAPAATLVTC